MDWYDDILKYDFPSFIGKTLLTCDPGADYIPNWHIDLIAEYLEAARKSEITRLIINMPPRSLKSVCASVAWPAWLIGHAPNSRIIAASYSSSLSIKHSIDCRLVLNSNWYRRIFPHVELASDQNEKSKFMTTKRGFRMATSVGGSVTGEGGNYLIVDDPINPSQAMNANWREHVNQWFDHTFSTRLNDKKKGVIILVMQRLHPNDLTAHLLEKGDWEHLTLPMIATEKEIHDFGSIYKERNVGEFLHNARDDETTTSRTKASLGSMAFAAQYQQIPMADDGGMVRPWWLGRYKQLPVDYVRCVQSWDTAIKSGAQHDASVCLTFLEYNGQSYLADASVMRLEYPDLKKSFYRLSEQWKPETILLEDKASGQQLIQDVRRESHLPVIGITPKGDKVTRFAAISAMIEAGRVVLPEYAPWLVAFEEELWLFPQGTHDDQVDALTQYLDWIRQEMYRKTRVRPI